LNDLRGHTHKRPIADAMDIGMLGPPFGIGGLASTKQNKVSVAAAVFCQQNSLERSWISIALRKETRNRLETKHDFTI
jgi:hypothetical protein